jgi:hypothetical protein
MHETEFKIPIGNGLEVNITYDYIPGEDLGLFGWRVAPQIEILTVEATKYDENPISESWQKIADEIAFKWIFDRLETVKDYLYERHM